MTPEITTDAERFEALAKCTNVADAAKLCGIRERTLRCWVWRRGFTCTDVLMPRNTPAKPCPSMPKGLTQEGAQTRANRLADYWRRKGYEVRAWVERGAFHHAVRGVHWDVRSDLINGLPTGWTGPREAIEAAP